MSNLLIRPSWWIPNRQATPEHVFQNRRAFLRQLGFGGGLVALSACSKDPSAQAAVPANTAAQPPPAGAALTGSTNYPAPRNKAFNPSWELTDAKVAGSYNNFYEFSLEKNKVKDLVSGFVIDPWSVKIGGLVDKPMTLDLNEMIREFQLEERVYRFRCVEAWAMVVPWTGFPLKKLIDKVAPKAEAKFLRMETFNRPEQAPGMRQMRNYPWPYFEGLRMDEAMHPLTFVATGIYGKPMPKQHGAPIRLVVPWKYGYKSIKSIVKIDFVDKQPSTFWEAMAPDEYPFESNVDPTIPHPRWSQATERMIDTGLRVKTQPYNGYGLHVASLYSKRT